MRKSDKLILLCGSLTINRDGVFLHISSTISLNLKKRAAQIKVLLMDVDGTMTDGGVTLLLQTEDSPSLAQSSGAPSARS